MGVVNMVNNLASKCHRCMYLIRLLTLNGLICNRRVAVKYVSSKNNVLSDALSRLKLNTFRKFGPHMNKSPDTIDEMLWPVSKLLTLADETR